jgi:hypothetical protein
MRLEHDQAISKLGGITDTVAQAAAASIQRTEARLATQLDAKREELAKFGAQQHEELRLKVSSLMGTVLAERTSQEKELPVQSAVNVVDTAAGSDTQAPPDILSVGNVFASDTKAIIGLLRQCVGQLEALRTQVHDIQPRVLTLEREYGNCDNRLPAPSARAKAANRLDVPALPDSSTRRPLLGSRIGISEGTIINTATGVVGDVQTSTLASAKQVTHQVRFVHDKNIAERAKVIGRDALTSSATESGRELGRGHFTRAENRPLAGSQPEEKSGEVVCLSGLRADRRSPDSLIARCSPSPPRQPSLSGTSQCAVRRGDSYDLLAGRIKFIGSAHPPSARCSTSSRVGGNERVLWPSSAGHGTNKPAENVANAFAERLRSQRGSQ